jgi:purine-binding chemotaxis protein CheW
MNQVDEETLVSTFYIEDALFGLYTQDVQEIVPCSQITRVHHAPDYIRGIMHLRGQIYTVVDLAMRLGLTDDLISQEGFILLVAWEGENVGLLVSQVSDVLPVDTDDLKPLPANVNARQREFIHGVYETSQHPVAVLDIHAILGDPERQKES